MRTPKGFDHAYKLFREGGWGGLNVDPEWGGQGLPHMVGMLIEEMMCWRQPLLQQLTPC